MIAIVPGSQRHIVGSGHAAEPAQMRESSRAEHAVAARTEDPRSLGVPSRIQSTKVCLPRSPSLGPNDRVDRARRLHPTSNSINHVEKDAPRAPVRRIVRRRCDADYDSASQIKFKLAGLARLSTEFVHFFLLRRWFGSAAKMLG